MTARRKRQIPTTGIWRLLLPPPPPPPLFLRVRRPGLRGFITLSILLSRFIIFPLESTNIVVENQKDFINTTLSGNPILISNFPICVQDRREGCMKLEHNGKGLALNFYIAECDHVNHVIWRKTQACFVGNNTRSSRK